MGIPTIATEATAMGLTLPCKTKQIKLCDRKVLLIRISRVLHVTGFYTYKVFFSTPKVATSRSSACQQAEAGTSA